MAQGVTIDFTANVAKFEQQIDKISGDLGKFQKSAQSAGDTAKAMFAGVAVGAAITGLSAFIKSGIDSADMLNDLSARTGVAVDQLAGLNVVATLGDTSLEAMGKGLNKLSVYMVQNADDAKALGITSKDNLEAFAQLSDALAGVEDVQKRAALGTAILGKGWQELAPVLVQGGDAIREQTKQGRELNPVTEQMAKSAGELNDKLDIMRIALQGVSVTLAGPIVEGMVQLIDYLGQTQRSLGDTGASFSVYKTVIDEVVVTVATLDHIAVRAGTGIGALAAKLTAIASLDFSGFNAIDKAFEDDINAANARYEQFVNKIKNPVNIEVPELLARPAAARVTDPDAVSNALGIGSKSSASVGRRSSGGGAERSAKDQSDSIIANLQREIALYDDTSKAAAARYDTEKGALAGLSGANKERIVGFNEELDRLSALKEQYQEFDQIIADGNQLAAEQSKQNEQVAEDRKNALRTVEGYLNEANQNELDGLKNQYELRRAIIIEGTIAEGEERNRLMAALETDYQQQRNRVIINQVQSFTAEAADGFSALSDISAKYWGEQSTQFKIAFAAQKAFMIATTIMQTYKAAQDSYASLASIPYVGPALGAAAAAVAVAGGLARVASISSQSYSGAAHGGLDYVPAEQTYLLNKGERVLSPVQNKDITDYVQKQKSGADSGNKTVNYYVNITTPNADSFRRSERQIREQMAAMS